MFVYQRLDAPIPKGTSCSGVFSAKKNGGHGHAGTFFLLSWIAALQLRNPSHKNMDGNLNALWFFDWCKNDCCWKRMVDHDIPWPWVEYLYISAASCWFLQAACSLPVFDNGVYRRHIKFWSDDDDDGDEVWVFLVALLCWNLTPS